MLFREAEREGLKEKEEKRWKNIRISPFGERYFKD